MRLTLLFPILLAYVVQASRVPLGSNAESQQLCVARDETTIEALNDIRTSVLSAFQNRDAENPLVKLLKDVTNTQVSPAEREQAVIEYVYSKLPFAIPSFVFLILGLLACPCFFVARCCCATTCCAPRDAYSQQERSVPLVCYMIFSTITLILAFVGIYELQNVQNGIVGGICELETLSGNAETFFTSFEQPINTIKGAIFDVVDEVEGTFNSSLGVVTAVNELQFHIAEIATNASSDIADINSDIAELPPASGVEVPNAMADVQADLSQVTDEVSGGIQSNAESLENLRQQVQSEFVEVQGSFSTIVDDAIAAITEIGTEISAGLDPSITSAKDSVVLGTGYTLPLSYAFYSVVFVAFVAGLLSIISAITKTKCDDAFANGLFTCSWCLTYLFMLLMFLLAGIVWPASVIGSDVCAVIIDVPSDFKGWTDILQASGTSGSSSFANRRRLSSMRALQFDSNTPQQDPFELIVGVMDGCFANPPLPVLSQLNVSQTFDLESVFAELQGESLSSLDGQNITNIEDLNVFSDKMNGVVIDQTPVTNSLSALNGLIDPDLTRADCTTTPECDKDCLVTTTCTINVNDEPTETARNATIDVIRTVDALGEVLEYIKSELALVDDQVVDIGGRVNTIFNNAKAAFASTQPVIDALNEANSFGDCGFVADRYYGIYNEGCLRAINSIQTFAITAFVIGIMAIPLLICSILVSTRIFKANKHHGEAVVEAKVVSNGPYVGEANSYVGAPTATYSNL